MTNANRALLSLCLLLAVASALAATTVMEAAAHRRLQRMPSLDNDDATGPVPRINVPGGPMVPLPPAAVACWKSILASENCVDDILESLAKLELRVSKVCCSVLEKIGDKCILDAFSSFPFNPLFPPLVKQVCSLAA
ncbi:hypothetical protein QOZ80_6AG0539060 [Eleusine coracana subsp. coracana]|nr:hypothetical protein QOZ80_6AG0539060 [Eleusine coracana subsp. coracana]